MKKLHDLIRRFKVWHEVGTLRAELDNIQRYGRYYDLRAPRIRKRLAELGYPVQAPESFAARHPELAAEQQRVQELFEPDGLVGAWKGPA